MHKLRLFITLVIIAQWACNAQSSSAVSSPLPTSSTTPPGSIIQMATESVEASPFPSATAESTVMPPPAIAPEFFAEARVMHEYWPVIRKEVGLWEKARFGMTQTAWALSPDGHYLAVAGCDAEAGSGLLFSYTSNTCEATNLDMVAHAFLLILDAQTEDIIATLPETGQALTVTQLAFTHDSKKLVYHVSKNYGLDINKIEVWDIPSRSIQAEISDAWSFEISPDDKWMALGLADGTTLWDFATEDMIAEQPDRGFAWSFSTDGKRLATRDYPYLLVYDVGSWQKISQQLLAPEGVTNTWALSPDLSVLAVCDTRLPDTPVKIWSVASAEMIQTLEGEWGRCGRLMFSPDGRLLLRFDEHGAGPVIWRVDGWKLIQVNANVTNFVGFEDYYVDRLQFSQDGQNLLVGTFKRLTLYALPPGVVLPPPSTAMPQPIANEAALPVPTIPPVACDIVAQGWVNAHVQPCLEHLSATGGEFDGLAVTISLRDSQLTGVTFYVPPHLVRRRFTLDKYIIGDLTDGIGNARIVAAFNFYDLQANSIDLYSSYDGGEFVLTQTEPYISGTFKFGARTQEGRQVSVEGSFENIPFSRVNLP